MSPRWLPPLLVWVLFCAGGCVTSWRSDYLSPKERGTYEGSAGQVKSLTPAGEKRILAMDADHVSEADVREVLVHAPAPRILCLHGGIPTVVKHMISFALFLEGMGYPEASLRNPRDGTYSFSGYLSSTKLAGMIAWHYEQEGLRPMIVGHSQGGFQVVRLLHQLAEALPGEIRVYNPKIGREEDRCEIIDPRTGKPRPVSGALLCYASVIGTGGMARLLPPNWTLTGNLHTIPDSVSAFTGYYMGMDIIGGDYLGFGAANHFQADDSITLRNVQLPSSYGHGSVPETKHLLRNPEILAWINTYAPTNRPTVEVEFDSKSSNLLFAADIWHDIKKHWVLELQRFIRAKRKFHDES